MKTPIEKEELLTEVLANAEELRAVTLRAGLTALQRKRRRRAVLRTATLMLPIAALVMLLAQRLLTRDDRTGQISKGTPTVDGTSIRVLSDEELLAFFDGQPVALVGPPGHQQLLLFDEARP